MLEGSDRRFVTPNALTQFGGSVLSFDACQHM
jgi:hypothetical protein